MKLIQSILLSLVFAACSEDKGVLPAENFEIQLSSSYSNNASDGVADDKITSLRYYICDKGVVTYVHNDIAADAAYINLAREEVTATGEIYIIANGELCPTLEQIVVGSAQTAFDNLRTSQSDNNGQMSTLIMSCRAALKTYVSGGVIPLALGRNVARFDLIVQPNVNIEVVAVRVDGLATSSSVFETASPQNVENAASYVGDFNGLPKTESVQRLFFAHERAVGGTVAVATIDVRYNGKLTTITAPLKAIKRNCIHKISVAANGGIVTAEVELSDMETGDEDESQTTDPIITINSDATVLSKGASIDMDNKRLILPATGASVSLVLNGPTGIRLTPIDNPADDFSITKVMEGEAEKSYTISTSANKRMSSDNRAIVLNFTYDGDKNHNTYRIVVILTNYAPFECVTFGNLDWMIYNAFSKIPSDYPQTRDGQTIKSVLAGYWTRYAGKAYQWGPRPGVNNTGVQYSLAAWDKQAYHYTALTNVNGGIISNTSNKAWTGETVPCPDGWRLPTYDEFQTIWPKDGTLIKENVDTTYITSKGNSLTAHIEVFGGNFNHWAPYGNYTAKNLCLRDVNKNEIIFPIAGHREPHGAEPGTWNYSGYGWYIGVQVYYWCANKIGKNHVFVGMNAGVSKNTTADRNPNTWLNIRCVRDVPTI